MSNLSALRQQLAGYAEQDDAYPQQEIVDDEGLLMEFGGYDGEAPTDGVPTEHVSGGSEMSGPMGQESEPSEENIRDYYINLLSERDGNTSDYQNQTMAKNDENRNAVRKMRGYTK